MNLRASRSLALGTLAAVGVGIACANADSPAGEANPYAIISDRNVFHLNAPPPPPAPEEKTVDLPEVKLSGLLKVGSNARALLAMPPKDQKEMTKYFNLAPGERLDPLELVKIDLDKGEVDIINSGTRVTLSLASNSFAAAAAASRPAGGAAPRPGMSGLIAGRQSPSILTRAIQSAGGFSLARGIPALSPGGVNAAVLSGAGAGSWSGGTVVTGGNTGGGGNSGVPSGSGSGSANGGAIVAGGNSSGVAASGIAYDSAAASGGVPGAVYVPPNPGSAAANMPGAQVGTALMNPLNGRYRTPTPPTLPGERNE